MSAEMPQDQGPRTGSHFVLAPETRAVGRFSWPGDGDGDRAIVKKKGERKRRRWPHIIETHLADGADGAGKLVHILCVNEEKVGVI